MPVYYVPTKFNVETQIYVSNAKKYKTQRKIIRFYRVSNTVPNMA